MKQNYLKKLMALAVVFTLCLPAQTALAASKEQIKEYQTAYEATAPAYQYDENATACLPSSPTSRFVWEDGIYRNPSAKATNEATLIITGDLMCQYIQQAAVFQSDGNPYLTYDDVKKIIQEATAKQLAAIEAAKKEAGNISRDKTPPTEDESMTNSDGDAPPAASSMTIPQLDLGVIPQPTGTFDFTKSFQYVKNIFSQGDLVIGNLETMASQSSPLGMQLHRLEDKPYLNAPLSYLDAVKDAGYDLLTMANNHNCDTGVQGILETMENVDAYGFMHTGLFTDERTPRYTIIDVNGIKIGFVAYATYFNQKENNLTAEGQEVMLNRFDTETARADIKAARAAGAEYVIAFMHWGAENTNETTANQERNARAIAKAGADYIVGSHPHALQHYDIIETADERQVPVIYSMGNFVSNMTRDINNDTIVLRLDLTKSIDENNISEVTLSAQRIYPCKVMKTLTSTDDKGNQQIGSYVIVPENKAYRPVLNQDSADSQMTQELLNASYARILKVFGNRLALPLPYDPYGVEADDQETSIFYNLSNMLTYIKRSAA